MGIYDLKGAFCLSLQHAIAVGVTYESTLTIGATDDAHDILADRER